MRTATYPLTFSLAKHIEQQIKLVISW